MARQTGEEKAREAQAQAEARGAAARAELEESRARAAGLLAEILDDMTAVQGSGPTPKALKDPKTDAALLKGWPPRFGDGTHRHDMKVLRRFDTTTWLKAVPNAISPFLLREGAREVPEEMWTTDVRPDGRPAAVVSCPCGKDPTPALGNFHFCEGTDCGRVFLNLGHSIRVVRLSEEQLSTLGIGQ